MILASDARSMALALPRVEESSHFDTPDFRVNGKIFATLPGPDRIIVRLDPNDQAVLLSAEPATFSPCPGAFGLRGWTIVQLGSVEPDILQDLLIASWGQIVGKRAAAALDASLASASAERGRGPTSTPETIPEGARAKAGGASGERSQSGRS